MDHSVDDEVTVRLKWNATEYTGRLVSVDGYMNVQLAGAQEWVAGRSEGVLGQVLIRWVSLLSWEEWGEGRWADGGAVQVQQCSLDFRTEEGGEWGCGDGGLRRPWGLGWEGGFCGERCKMLDEGAEGKVCMRCARAGFDRHEEEPANRRA